ncbi:MAG: mechanosensitive ion channel family protein [Pseudomonadales bacterium]
MIDQELQQIQQVYDLLTEFLVNYSFQLVGAIIIFLIGLFVAKKVAKLILRLCEKHQLDITLSNFIANTLRIIVIIMAAVIALGKVGISVTPMVAAIGALSLGAGLAVQGLLSNYGAGLTIIVTRPFVIGNTISVQGVTGLVKDISLGYTILTNEDGVEITIPNKHIVGEILHNSFANTLVDSSIGISYDADPDKAIAVIQQCLKEMNPVSQDPAPQVGIDNFGDSAIEIGVRYWVPTETYFNNKYQTNLRIFKALQQANITIPFPQREVRLLNQEKAASSDV